VRGTMKKSLSSPSRLRKSGPGDYIALVPSHPSRLRGPRLLLPSAIALGLIIGAGLAIVAPSAPAVGSNTVIVAGASEAPALTAAPMEPTSSATSGQGTTDTPPTTSAPPPTSSGQQASTDVVPPLSSLTGYQWPLPHARITLPFGPTPWGTRIVEGQKFHDGVDLATFCGDKVVAAHDGVVLAAGRHFDHAMGWMGDLGRYTERLDRKHLWGTLPIVVVIDDGNGYRSVYAHFAKTAVKRGQVVEAGELIGYEGMTGRASGCHCHYGLFSPAETSAFPIERAVSRRMKLPAAEIARVDPLDVLPPRP
jgi:murein DD-endopeptidase MepM/ murein hydrolase activator NlpD